MASIMDIKFCNEVIEILIENCERFFPSVESSPEFLHTRRPSLETSAASSSSQGEPPSPAVVSKCKRTQSFSSFSQLSTASLPDIKELPRQPLPHQDRDRPRSKSHQHELPPVMARAVKESSPAPLHLSKAATQVENNFCLSPDSVSVILGHHWNNNADQTPQQNINYDSNGP